MKWIIYYATTLLLHVITLVIFREQINITSSSLVVILLISLSVFSALYYHHNKDANTTYSVHSDITDPEWRHLASYRVYSYLIIIPIFLPFIWFFSSWFKLFSVLIFLLAFAGGSILFRIKHRKALQERYCRERHELWEQQRKEELGQRK